MDAVDFLHHENPLTCSGMEPATLDAESINDFKVANFISKNLLSISNKTFQRLLVPAIPEKSRERSICKEPLPAPGNRSNETRYREKDLATTEEKKVGTGKERAVKRRYGWTTDVS
ncbi:hypothetical protein TNCV_455291 [Trichonephila clavipes]|nr:hypothetical protein TNCV_455291 [Trichonephila clavipes]